MTGKDELPSATYGPVKVTVDRIQSPETRGAPTSGRSDLPTSRTPHSDDEEHRQRVHERSYWQRQLTIARHQNWITILGSVGAIIGLILVYFQLSEARRGNELSKSSFIEGNKAFIYQKGFTWLRILDANGNIAGWEPQVTLVNSGNTPTKIMMFQSFSLMDTHPPALGSDGFPIDMANAPVQTFIPPHETLNVSEDNRPLWIIQEVQDGKRSWYTWGWAEYRDVFPGTPCHRLRFYFKVLIVNDVAHFQAERVPFAAVPVDRHEFGWDDNCTHQSWVPQSAAPIAPYS